MVQIPAWSRASKNLLEYTEFIPNCNQNIFEKYCQTDNNGSWQKIITYSDNRFTLISCFPCFHNDILAVTQTSRVKLYPSESGCYCFLYFMVSWTSFTTHSGACMISCNLLWFRDYFLWSSTHFIFEELFFNLSLLNIIFFHLRPL